MKSSDTKDDINGIYRYIHVCVCVGVHVCVYLYIPNEQLITKGKVLGAKQVTAHQMNHVKISVSTDLVCST